MAQTIFWWSIGSTNPMGAWCGHVPQTIETKKSGELKRSEVVFSVETPARNHRFLVSGKTIS